jgi:hypothetical protein
VRGNKKTGSVRRNVPHRGKRQGHWHRRDLSPGYRNLSSALRLVLPIEVEPASIGSDKILGTAVVSDLDILGDSQRRQRSAQVPDCSGKTDDENDSAG